MLSQVLHYSLFNIISLLVNFYLNNSFINLPNSPIPTSMLLYDIIVSLSSHSKLNFDYSLDISRGYYTPHIFLTYKLDFSDVASNLMFVSPKFMLKYNVALYLSFPITLILFISGNIPWRISTFFLIMCLDLC